MDSLTAGAALAAALRSRADQARELRRILHRSPDVSGDEARTRDIILEHLPASATVEQVADTGAVVRIGPAGPAVAVRAELDALPLNEETTVAWRSEVGVMHACGHDVHMAAAVALATAVDAMQSPTPLVLILQPREETLLSGARDILGSGTLERHEIGAVIGAHVQPLVESGVVDCAAGAVNASSDEFAITIEGNGGHAGYPHLGSDCLLAMAQFITMIQQLVSRETNPMEAAVVSVGELHAGHSPNVLPNSAVARGTVRATSEGHRVYLLQRLEEIARGVSTISECAVTLNIEHGEPALVNDSRLAHATREVLSSLGVSASEELRSCGADDFAFYGADYPALMMFVGTGDAVGRLHSPEFLPADETVDHVALALAAGYLASGKLIG